MRTCTVSKETLKSLLALNFLYDIWLIRLETIDTDSTKKVNAEEKKRLEEKSKEGLTSIVLGLFFGKGRILTGRTRPVELLSKH